MRFASNGPAIPESLIRARNAGDVVLLCGAGVSIPIMPGFERLTDDVIADLGAAKARGKRDAGLPLDIVFKEMVKECGPAHVADAIYRRLRVRGRPNVDRHAALIDLATTPDRRVQLITTNFDHLFEIADPELPRHIAPFLPDVALDDPLHGLVYLHGRLQKPVAGTASKLVLSSNEFGRAYLAQGWATRFLRDISRRHSILMVGYSANDPPVNYLLEGFSEADGRRPIYTFLSDDKASDIDAWRDRGVVTIPYERVDDTHSGLWQTLLAWASASRDPAAWQEQLIAIAQQQPASLQSYQRGQVANLVRSQAGAMAFSQATPPPPAEWLCVFDPSVRFGRPGTANFLDSAPVDDPLDAYGLDDDVTRDPERRDGEQAHEADNLLGWQEGDVDIRGIQRLSGWTEQFSSALAPRQYFLANWTASIMHQPASLWWASRTSGLHPGLIDALKRRIGHGPALDPRCRLAWQHVMSARNGGQDNDIHRDWYDLQRDIERDGWTPSVLRSISEALCPRWTVVNSWMGGPLAPRESEDTEWARIAPVEPEIGGHGLALPDPPDDVLAELVDIAGAALRQFASMMAECDRRFWHVPTLHPTGEPGEVLDGESLSVILWFKDLFLRLVALDPARARRRFEDWQVDEPYLFAKFTMLGTSLAKFIPAAQAGARLLAIPDNIFWDAYNRRDLLNALKNRWSEFDGRTRQRVERRIIKGPPRWRSEPLKDYRHRRTGEAASVLQWLALNGRKLSSESQARLPELIKATPGWRDSWAAMADDSMGPRGGVIEQDLDTQGLERVQLGDVVRVAEALSTEEFRELKQYRPFRGLAALSPLKALSSLRRARRDGTFSAKYWKDIISEWPDAGHGRRMDWLLARTLAALSPQEALELRYYVPAWLDKHIGRLSEGDFASALSVFEGVVSKLAACGPDAFTSGLGETRIGNVVQKESNLSMSKAINAPGGKLAEALLKLLGQPTERGSLPGWFTENAERLMGLQGDGGGHAVCVLCARYSFLEYWGKNWARRKLLTKFALDNPLSEAAWHGLPYGNGASRSAWLKIKPHFANLIVGNMPWILGRDAHRSLLGWFSRSCLPSSTGQRLFNAGEAKEMLASCDVPSLASVLSHWRSTLGRDQTWNQGVGSLIRAAWPKQASKRTDATINGMISLASAAGDSFPDAVRDIRLHLDFVQKLEIWDLADRRHRGEGPVLSQRYPQQCMEIMEAVARPGFTNLPYDFREFILSLGANEQLKFRGARLLASFSI